LHLAKTQPTRVMCYFLDAEDHLTTLTAADLLHNAMLIAAGLRARGIGPGHRVVLSFETGPHFIESLFGCSLAGAVPCLVELPSAKIPVGEWTARLHAKLELLDARAILIDSERIDLVAQVMQDRFDLFVATADELITDAPLFEPSIPAADTVAFIQFTSGTTGDARGVPVTHQALFANCGDIAIYGAWDSDDLTVSWLPLYHDMGLVSSFLASFLHGIPTVLMSPLVFLFSPARWLWALHVFRGTLSFAPNFAYELCVKRVAPADSAGLDLGAWRQAYNAAEFIHVSTLVRFAERFSSNGMTIDRFRPAYGMAEMVAGASIRYRDDQLRIDTISRSALATRRVAVPTTVDSTEAIQLVSTGRPLPSVEVRIVDETGSPCEDRREGEILLRGASLFRGYYNNSAATIAMMREGWLLTGDLGYFADDELIISGRVKDLIIKAGENIHPYAIEHEVGGISDVRTGCVAVVGLRNGQTGTEDVVVVFETMEEQPNALQSLCRKVEQAVIRASGMRADMVIPVPPRIIPKTTSGKIRRTYIRDHIEQFIAASPSLAT
jgi:fatty-acyl-CoA synthase